MPQQLLHERTPLARQPTLAEEGQPSLPQHDPSGRGALGSPRMVRDEQRQPQQATLEDRGVRGAFLSCGGKELPHALYYDDLMTKPSLINSLSSWWRHRFFDITTSDSPGM